MEIQFVPSVSVIQSLFPGGVIQELIALVDYINYHNRIFLEITPADYEEWAFYSGLTFCPKCNFRQEVTFLCQQCRCPVAWLNPDHKRFKVHITIPAILQFETSKIWHESCGVSSLILDKLQTLRAELEATL